MSGPWYQDDSVTVWHGDCLDVLRTLPDNSIDAVVTDPPYGLEFMGKDWDAPWKGGDHRQTFDGTLTDVRPNPYGRSKVRFGSGASYGTESAQVGRAFQAWCELWAIKCLRVLKPGGHMLAFGGTRTHHRLACAIEDAGFEIRDSIAWLYASGFPKSLDVSKAIDKAAGVERETLGRAEGAGSVSAASLGVFASEYEATAPATDAARRWQGWGTALKPAHEPIVVARKPLAGTVADNVQQWGTGALNIDGCRVGTDVITAHGGGVNGAGRTYGGGAGIPALEPGSNPHVGRWPPNVLLDPTAAAELDRQSGRLTSGLYKPEHADSGKDAGTYGAMTGRERTAPTYGDSGGASRFFPVFRYEPKAPTYERPRDDSAAHPTVKPLDLMRWLVRLVTPPGGLVLDPFAGSGTTAEACVVEGLRCVTIEREPTYLPLIRARLTKPIALDLFGGMD